MVAMKGVYNLRPRCGCAVLIRIGCEVVIVIEVDRIGDAVECFVFNGSRCLELERHVCCKDRKILVEMVPVDSGSASGDRVTVEVVGYLLSPPPRLSPLPPSNCLYYHRHFHTFPLTPLLSHYHHHHHYHHFYHSENSLSSLSVKPVSPLS